MVQRAWLSVNRPWMSDATQEQADLVGGLTQATEHAANARRRRFYALQAMILGGPDGQVM